VAVQCASSCELQVSVPETAAANSILDQWATASPVGRDLGRRSSLVDLPLDQLLRKQDRRSEVVSLVLLGFVEVAPKETCGRIRDELGGRMPKDLMAVLPSGLFQELERRSVAATYFHSVQAIYRGPCASTAAVYGGHSGPLPSPLHLLS